MKYRIIEVETGEDAGDDMIVTPGGQFAWWSESAGWDVADDQSKYAAVLIEYSHPVLDMDRIKTLEAFKKASSK